MSLDLYDTISFVLIVTDDKDPWLKPNLPPIKSQTKKGDAEKPDEKPDKEPGNKDVELGGTAHNCTEERESFASKMIKSVFCLI